MLASHAAIKQVELWRHEGRPERSPRSGTLKVDTVGGKMAIPTTSASGPHPQYAVDTWVANNARSS
jgi:hypothetical protein